MKILVTGSRGFVGKKLVSVLRKKGHKVREFDLALGHDLLNGKQCIEACKGDLGKMAKKFKAITDAVKKAGKEKK